MALLTMDDIMAKVSRLPAMPQIVTRILETLNDENANIESLTDMVASDPAVAVRLLAASNSGLFGGHRVSSLRQAMILLGVGRVRQITVATAVIDRFRVSLPFDSRRLWRHSIAVGICAQDIARFADIDPEVAYMAGLLHDIGQLLMFVCDPLAYAEVMRESATGDRSIVDYERARFGMDHAKVGGELAKRWNLPYEIIDAISSHHDICADRSEAELSDVVSVAEALAHALDLGETGTNRVPTLCELASARLGIDWREFADHFPAIEARFDGAVMTLGL